MAKKEVLLSKTPVFATIPVSNMHRAKTYYTEVLGLKTGKPFPNGIILDAGNGTSVALFHRPPVKHENTVAWFTVTDFDKTATELRAKGVVFDEYDIGGMRHAGDGVYLFAGFKVAWFKDTEGNILAIGTRVSS